MGVGEPIARTEVDHCKNCDAAMVGPYCAACGQRVPLANPTFVECLRDSTHELTRWDGKVPATLKALLCTPGFLTEEFLAGRRARWLSPLRLYLICSIAYFLTLALVDSSTGQSTQIARIGVSPPPESGRVTLPPEARAQLEAVGARRLFGDERFERMAADLDALNANVAGTLADTMPKIMFALMPMFAVLTWLVWRDGGARYPMHLYFALHLHAVWFVAMLGAKLSELSDNVVVVIIGAVATIGYSSWYCMVAFKRVLGGSSSQLFVRSSIVGIIYGVLVLAILLAAMAYTLLNY